MKKHRDVFFSDPDQKEALKGCLGVVVTQAILLILHITTAVIWIMTAPKGDYDYLHALAPASQLVFVVYNVMVIVLFDGAVEYGGHLKKVLLWLAGSTAFVAVFVASIF